MPSSVENYSVLENSAPGVLLGPSRDWAPDHGPLSDCMAAAGHHELGIIMSESQDWLDTLAIHCMKEMVHLSQIWTGSEAQVSAWTGGLDSHVIYVCWTNIFLSVHIYPLVRRFPWPVNGGGKILGWFKHGSVQYSGDPKVQCWEETFRQYS